MPVSRCPKTGARPGASWAFPVASLSCAAVLALTLGGCGGVGGSSSAAAKASAARVTATGAASTASTASTVSTVSTASTVSGGSGSGSGRTGGSPIPRTAPPPRPTRRCATGDLAVAAVNHEVKQGLDVERFAVTTSAPAGCVLTGPPDLRPKGPLSAQVPGATVDLAVSQLPVPDGVGLPTGDGAAVPLLPGGTASFYLAWYSASPIVCVQSDGFGFNAPGDTTYSDMKPVGYDLGPVCDGIFYVSPVF